MCERAKANLFVFIFFCLCVSVFAQYYLGAPYRKESVTVSDVRGSQGHGYRSVKGSYSTSIEVN